MQKYYFGSIICLGGYMKKNKEEAIKLITKKIKNDSYLTYDEISLITGYHTKYLFKLKNDILMVLSL